MADKTKDFPDDLDDEELERQTQPEARRPGRPPNPNKAQNVAAPNPPGATPPNLVQNARAQAVPVAGKPGSGGEAVIGAAATPAMPPPVAMSHAKVQTLHQQVLSLKGLLLAAEDMLLHEAAYKLEEALAWIDSYLAKNKAAAEEQ